MKRMNKPEATFVRWQVMITRTGLEEYIQVVLSVLERPKSKSVISIMGVCVQDTDVLSALLKFTSEFKETSIFNMEFKPILNVSKCLTLSISVPLKDVGSSVPLGQIMGKTKSIKAPNRKNLGVNKWCQVVQSEGPLSLHQWSSATAAVSEAVSKLNRSVSFDNEAVARMSDPVKSILSQFGYALSQMDDQAVELASGMLRRCAISMHETLSQKAWREVYDVVVRHVSGSARGRLYEGMLGCKM